MKPRLYPALLVGTVMLAMAGCGGEKDVVTVDGDAVTMEEFNQYLQTKRTVRVVVQGQVVEVPVAETLAFQALQDLATQKLVLHMAADEGLLPTEADVEAEIEFKKKINPRYLTELKAAGYSMGQIRREVKFALAEERLITRGITVTKDEVDRIIAENPEQFIEPASLSVYEILALSPTRRQEVDRELSASQPFKSVATKLTQNPQGPRKTFAIQNMQEPLKSALADKPVGFVSDWIAVGNGHVRYLIDAKTEDTPVEMTPEKRELLRRQMAMSYGRQANDLAKKVAEKLRSSEVRVNDDEAILKDMWKRFSDQLEQKAADVAKADAADVPSEG